MSTGTSGYLAVALTRTLVRVGVDVTTAAQAAAHVHAIADYGRVGELAATAERGCARARLLLNVEHEEGFQTACVERVRQRQRAKAGADAGA